MATARLEVSQQLNSGDLPRDACINVLHYTGGTDFDALATSVLAAFDGTAVDADGDAFSLYATSTITVTAYDIADAKPRPEKAREVQPRTGTGNWGARLLACCLSFYGTRNLPRQRGRIYIGPLQASETGGAGVSQNVINNNIVLAKLLYAAGDNSGWQHCIRSNTSQSDVIVTDYWVDNAWDVMHSREQAASSRAVWSPVP